MTRITYSLVVQEFTYNAALKTAMESLQGCFGEDAVYFEVFECDGTTLMIDTGDGKSIPAVSSWRFDFRRSGSRGTIT